MNRFPSWCRFLALCFPLGLWASAGGSGGYNLTESMMMLAAQLGVVLLAAKAGNLLFARLKQPAVLGELLSGVVIGPFALGAISLPGFREGLFPLPEAGGAVSPELYAFAAVASIILLFDVGLETDLKLLFRYSAAGGLVGLGGVLVSFGLGMASTALFSGALLGIPLRWTHPVCLFMGVVSTATSVGITARVFSEKRKLDSPEGVTVLSAAVVDDVIGIILLAVVLGMVSATSDGGAVNWGEVGWIGVRAILVWLGVTAAGIALSPWISQGLKRLKDGVSMSILALALALVLASLFEQVGLAMIIGAYVAGLSLSRTDISHLLREKLHGVYALLVPVFFCVTGMMIDLNTLLSGPVLLFGGVFSLVALFSKFVGCGAPALFAGFNPRGAARIGAGMTPRGEVGLIVAGIGTNVALMPDGAPLPPTLFASVVLMVMVSTLLGPPLLSRLLEGNQPGFKPRTRKEDQRLQIEFELPGEELAEFFTRHLLDTFEEEGYFWHRLDRDLGLYQFRKNTAIIDYRVDGGQLRFSGTAQDLQLVRAMLIEAAASFESGLRGLRQPFDTRSLGHEVLSDSEHGTDTGQLRLADYLDPLHIVLPLRSKDKSGVIDELLRRLAERGEIPDINAAREAIWEREEKMSTALEEGVAIPHGKTDTIDRLVAVMGLAPEGIDANAMDGKPSRYFVLTLSPKSKPGPHIPFMSAVSQALDEKGRAFLDGGPSAKEIHRYLQNPEG